MKTRTKTSSRASSTLPQDGCCPGCGQGALHRVVGELRVMAGGRRRRVPGLLPLQCDHCGVRIWPTSEEARARRVAKVMAECSVAGRKTRKPAR